MADERQSTPPEREHERNAESEVDDLDVGEREAEDVKGGNVTFQDFTISKRIDKSSPNL